MAPPDPIQVYVEKTTLSGNRAVPYLNPIETNRKGEATGVVFAVPVFGERNAFLVVRLPQSVAQDLARAVSDKPEAERDQFIREWVKQNQLAIYDQYISQGGKSRRFRYDVIPVKAPVLSATPVRTPAQQAEAAKPSVGRRLSIPDEGEAQKPAVVKAAPKKSEELAPLVPLVPKAPVKVELPPLPKEVKGGNGTRSNPYLVEASVGRDTSGEGLGAAKVTIPIGFSIEPVGRVSFKFDFTLSQLKPDSIAATSNHMWMVFQGALARFAAENNKVVDNTSVRDARKNFFQQVYSIPDMIVAKDPDTATYLGR